MKKFLFVLLAVLLIAGSAQALSIPQSEDAKAGPGISLRPVFNNDTTTLSAGDVVVWDIGSSTGDNDNYVIDTATADTYIVAGVVWPNSIPAKSRGHIAVHGVVDCDIVANGVQTGGLICSSTTEGEGQTCGVNDAAYAIATAVIANTTGKCLVIVE